jgi:tetratricopeptide (TPR) repeat protein
MKTFNLFLFLSFSYIQTFSQTKEVDEAKDYIVDFQANNNKKDLQYSFDKISSAMKLDKNKANADALYLDGYITKLYYDNNNISPKYDLINRSYKSLNQVLSLNPKYIEKEKLLTLIVYICFDMYQEGINLFKEKKNEDAYKLYKNLIEASQLLKKNERTIEVKEKDGKVIRLDQSEIINNFVIFCINSDKKIEAKEALLSDLKVRPSSLKYTQAIQLLGQLGENEQKDILITEARKVYPSDQDILIYDINLNIEKKNSQGALKSIREAIQLDPNNVKLYLVEGQILDETDDDNAAQQAYERGLKLYPDNFDLNYNLARTLFNVGLGHYNQKDVASKNKALEYVQKAKTLFVKCKTLNPDKQIELEKVLIEVEKIK